VRLSRMPVADVRPESAVTSPAGSRRSRRAPRVAAVLLALLTAAGAAAPGAASAATSTQPMMFGAEANSRSDVQEHEQVLGGRLNGLRVYMKWDSKLFGADQVWARDTGHTLFVSIRSARSNGTAVKFADVANAKPGSALYADIVRQAEQIKAFGAPVYIAYNHEPEAHEAWSYGTGPQFAAAWRNVISIYRNAGVTNAKYVWTMTSYGFIRTDEHRASLYYPGDAYVDHIAADGYNWYRCRTTKGKWTELAEILEGQRQFGLKHPSKGLMVWEFGSAEDPAVAGRKAQWLRNATQLFTRPGYEQYKVALSWEGRGFTGDGPYCGFDYVSSTSAKQAWVDMGRSATFSASRVG